MPAKEKAAGKTKASEVPKPSLQPNTTTTAANNKTNDSAIGPAIPTASTTTINTKPQTVLERTQSRYAAARPYESQLQQNAAGSLAALAPHEQSAWLATRIAARIARRPALSSSTTTSGGAAPARLACGGGPKTLKEVWRVVNETGVPLRAAAPRGSRRKSRLGWALGPSCSSGAGQVREEESVRAFEKRWERKVWLTCLGVESRCFKARRERERRGLRDERTGQPVVVTEQEVLEEKRRRSEMAALKKEVHGAGAAARQGKLASDPEWDDVVPVVLEEPEGALASIAYPADYAEAMAYLRAVMQAKEHSQRCLRLTELIIGMNASHYTVWLYRAANVFALNLPIPDEIEWLNRIALANLKNYQIWHHRHLLVENYFPTIANDAATVAAFAASEREFLLRILAEDTKNYHVWSYRSYLVGKLGLFSDAAELASIEAMIDDDVRNNSAWSHRFFLVFSNPEYATPGVAATEADPKVPAAVVDREVAYAQEKIRLAPQNQSGWNYMRGALVKGGRKLAPVEEFASEFVKGLGQDDEDVQSTHALDLLAEIYAEQGQKEKADLSLLRLGQKWDRIRVGYWEWRRKCLEAPA